MPNEPKQKQGNGPVRLALAAIAAVGSVSLAVYQYIHTHPTGAAGLVANQSDATSFREPKLRETDDGRQLLWARGPHEGEAGEWFDVTGSPLKPDGYQYGIGKDSIPSIDQPKFIAIHQRDALRTHGITDETDVIGYVHNGEARAYPIRIMNRHELVNDIVGGKPVTVGW